ncbi:MAG TPA: TRAP transporter fused permease subunit [Hyphomicrobiaceae bacterium]|nr:TRAP transporter fused permease subunit [Hyphomicrobiaceae bacterium]
MVDRLKPLFSLSNTIFVLGTIQLAWLIWYYYTGLGGDLQLVTNVMPIALSLQILFMYRQDYLYKFLPPVLNHIVVIAYLAVCACAFAYFQTEYERLAIYAMGDFTQQDFIVGLLMFLLVMELTRLAHPVLFWVNVVLIVYTMWGYLSPIDFFWHPGTTFYRVVTSSTVEFSTGIYGIYGQLALTLIAAFLLLAAAANGFGAQNAMIQVMRRLAGRSRQLVPQTAVMGSLAVGMVSGSGSANAAVVGTITIPLMKRYGVPGTFAAASETAASMGGLIMPPMMGVGAFLMSDFLGVPYWEVVKRGFSLALVYYASIAFAIYLMCVRLLPRDHVAAPKVPTYHQVRTLIFFSAVAFLLYLMGWAGRGELLAALQTAIFLFALLVIAFLIFKHALHEPELEQETLWGSIRRAIETHADMTSYLTLLLATLGIMIGLFTVTGFINRMGQMIIDLGAANMLGVIGMAYVFGWLAGAGLPPTATYIIGAIVIVHPMQELGINPWIAHFFVFLLSVWGELSPPTSLTAAVSARIAEASFMRTMYDALKICAPITLMTFAIFTRSDMVVTPGWAQVLATVLVFIGTSGVAFALFGRFFENAAADIPLRLLLAALAFVVLFLPGGEIGSKPIFTVDDMSVLGLPITSVELLYAAAAATVAALAVGVVRHSRFGSTSAMALPVEATVTSGDAAALIAEAKRDLG